MTMASTVVTSKAGAFAFDSRFIETVVYVAAATGVTGTGNTTSLDLGGPGRGGSFNIAVTGSASDTYNCTALVQTSPDNATWVTAVSFTAFTADTTEVKPVAVLDRYVRVSWTKNSGTMLAEVITVNGVLTGND